MDYKNNIMWAAQQLALMVAPSVCAYCRQFLSVRAPLCTTCATKIIPVISKQLEINSAVSMKVFSIAQYKDPLKKMILAKKWSDRTTAHQLGQLLWELTPLLYLDYDIVVPIPLHWTRYAWRGFNQAAVIADCVARKKGVPMVNLLQRVKRTRFQSALSSVERQANLVNAFLLEERYIKMYHGVHILLIDDLMTTGYTLKAAAKELLKLKPKRISGAVICSV